MTDATIEIEARLVDQMSGALKAIQHEMARLEKTTFESTKGIKKELDALKKKAEEQKSAFKDATGSAMKWAGGIAAGVLSIRVLTGVLSKSITEAVAAREAQADLAATLKSTGFAAGVTQDELNKMADALSMVTNFEDDAITKSQAMLLTFTKIGKEVFPEATEATLNLAQKFKTDASSAAIQLGKALNDPIQGVTALRRVGVAFTEQQQEQIKALTKSGDLLGAQRMILAELSTEFGGLARASADPLKQFQNQLNNVMEDLGTALLPALDAVTKSIGEMIAEGNKTGQLESAFMLIGDAASLAAKAIGGVVSVVSKLNEMEGRSGGTGIGSVQGATDLKNALQAVKKAEEDIARHREQTKGYARASLAPEEMRDRLAGAKADVERIAGTVAAPGILANLDRNISALEHRIEKLQKTPTPSAGGSGKPGGSFDALTDAQRKAIDEQEKLDTDAREKALKREIEYQNKQAKYRDEMLGKVRAAHEVEAREAREASRIFAEAKAGDDEMALLKIEQQAQLDSYAGNEQAITDLKRAHALERANLETELREKSKQEEEDLADAKIAAGVRFTNAMAGLVKALGKENKAAARAAAVISELAAIASTAAGVMKAFEQGGMYGFLTGAAIAAEGAIQIATIESAISKFEKGGPVYGASHARGGVPAELEGGELVWSRQDVNRAGGMESANRMRQGSTNNFNPVINVHLSGAASPADGQMVADAVLRTLARNMKEIEYRGITA